MKKVNAYLGWAVMLGSLALSGCGARKGDLGADYHADNIGSALAETKHEPAPPLGDNTTAPAPVTAADLPTPAGDTPAPVAVAPAPVPVAAPEVIAVPAPVAVTAAAEAVPAPVVASAAPAPLPTPTEIAAARLNEAAVAVAPAPVPAPAPAAAPLIDTAKTEPAPAAPVVAEAKLVKEPVVAPGDPVTTPPPANETPEDRAKRLMEEAAKLQGFNAVAKVTESNAALEAGKRLYNDLQFEEAVKHFETAVTLDPGNREAQEYMRKTRGLLGKHLDKFGEQIRRLDQEQRVRIQESLVALYNAMAEAEQLELKGGEVPLQIETAAKEDQLAYQIDQLRQAQTKFRKVGEIINWMPPPLELPKERQMVNDALTRVMSKIAEKEDELSFLKRLKAQEMANKNRLHETEMHKQRVSKLLDQVADFYNRGQYRDCEALAQRVMILDPLNKDAESWKRKARGAAHVKETRDYRTKYSESMKTAWESVEESHIPYGDLLVYPKDWDRIAKRTDRAAIGKSKVEETWKSDIRKKLERKVSFEFVDTPLDEAIGFLRSLTNVTMIVDPKVMEAGAPPINLRVSDMSLELALQWILRLADLDYALKDKALFISKKSNIIEDVELRIYDVSDLTQTIPDFPGPELQLTTQDSTTGAAAGGGAALNPFAAAAAPATAVTTQTIAEMIRNRVAPDKWDAGLGTSIEERAGKLVVMQRPEVHGLIDQLLGNFRATQKIMVNIESRFLTIREAYLENIGVEWQGIDPSTLRGDFGDIAPTLGLANQTRLSGDDINNLPWPGFVKDEDASNSMSIVGSISNSRINFFPNADRDTISGRDLVTGGANNTTGQLGGIRQGGFSGTFTMLSDPQAQAMVRALADRENTSILIAPRLTVFNTQRAHMFVAQQRAYVADYEISGDSYDPTIRQILTGVVLDVRPTVSADRHYVTLEMRPTVTELAEFTTRVIHSYSINQGANVAVLTFLSFPIQFPTLLIQRVRTTAIVPDGGILLLAGLQKNIKFHAENGVPFMSDLPVIGRLFRWNVVDNSRTNLAILVSPRIVLFNEEEAKL
jgi:Flp pilus assembly secretin CpaC